MTYPVAACRGRRGHRAPGPPPGQPFSPASIPGLVLWLRADAGTFQDVAMTVPAAADGVQAATWQDQSGLGHHVTQATAANQPLLKLAVRNGLPVLRLDGINDSMASANGTLYPQPVTLAGAAASSVVDDNADHWLLATGNVGNFLQADWVQNKFGASLLYGVSADQAWHSLIGVCDGANSAFSVDGVRVAGATTPGADANPPFRVGARGAGRFWKGDVGELLVYSRALSTQEVSSLNAYLSARWGTPSGLVVAPKVVSTPFNISPPDLTDQMAADLRSGGFNTVTAGFFQNPTVTGAPDFPAWKAGFDSGFNFSVLQLNHYGFSWLATGDDLCRTAAQLAGSTTGYGPQAVAYAVAALAGSGLCVGIEMVDETNIEWAAGPDPAMYGLVANMRSVQGCPPISWPLHVQNQTPSVAPWCDPSICDYVSIYSPAQSWFVADLPGQQYSVPKGVQALQSGLARAPGPTRSTLISWSGDFGNGPTIEVGAWRPQLIEATVWLALALGVKFLRLYAWDTAAWAAGRQSHGPTQDWATGTTPTVGPDRWQVSSVSLGLINAIAAQVTGPDAQAPAWASGWITAAKAKAFWAINGTESPLTVSGTVPALANACVLDPLAGRQDLPPASVPGSAVPGGGVLVMWDD